MLGSIVNYQCDDLTMVGEIFLPHRASAPRPAILVLPEGAGCTSYIRSRARKFAELGFVAMMADLYGDAQSLNDLSQMQQKVQEIVATPGGLAKRARAAFDALRNRDEVDPDRIVAVGYCIGGTMALELARSGADLAAAAVFHGGLAREQPDVASQLKCRVMVCLGSEDCLVSRDDRLAFEDEMRAAGIDWQFHIFGGAQHSFTNPDADLLGLDIIKYDARADARSWSLMQQMLSEIF